jgi:phosphoserine phosphatase RsbU/P
MYLEFTIPIIVIFLIILWIWGIKNRRKFKKSERDRRAIVGEEERMFNFLHNLGEAIEKDTSQARVNRMIIDGEIQDTSDYEYLLEYIRNWRKGD